MVPSDTIFQAILDQAPLGIAQVGLDGTWLLVNDRYCQMLGYSETELRTKTLNDITHPDDYPESVTGRQRLLEGITSTHSMEKRFIRKDGSIFWGRLHRSLVRDSSNLPQFFVAVVEDINEIKNAERVLHENEERLRLAVSAGLGLWNLDLRGNTATLAPHYEGAFGKAPRDGTEWLRLVHPDDRERIGTIARESLKQGRDWEAEFRIVLPNGSIRWLLSKGTVLLADELRPRRMMGVSFDITERKQIEERLRASEARLMSAERLAKLGSWERDDVTGKTEFSDEMLRILGMPDSLPLTLTEFLNCVHPDDREYVWKGAQRARSSGSSVAGEYRIVRADGEVRFVRSMLEAVRNESGAVIGVVGATQDITDLKRSQVESAAKQRLESVGTLASGIAHDFNNLLGGVLAQTELALGEVDTESLRVELKAIQDVAIRGSEIVRQLMVYAGKENESPGFVNLSEIVEQMKVLLEVTVSKHATVKTDLQEQLPAIRANTAQISQLVMNLVTNASEAMGDRDGTIQVSTRRISLGPDAPGVHALAEEEYVQLEVSDTGQGMSPETCTRVFEPFFTTKSAGRGLGLSVVHGIVDHLGGTIHLASEVGRGTTFLILLPSAEASSAAVPKPVFYLGQSAVPLQATTVLLVEDERSIRQAASKMLHKEGFSVIEAPDGSAALEVIRAPNNPIDVLFLDVTLPGTPGRTVLDEARRLRPEMRVVVTSAYPEEMAVASLQTTVERFIRKPYRLDALLDILRQTLS